MSFTTASDMDTHVSAEIMSTDVPNTTLPNVPIIYGLVPKDYYFYAIHYTALISLGISIFCSICTLIYQQKITSERNVFRRKVGERLVVYLAITDLVYSVSHTCDHLISLLYVGLPPVIPCVVFAFSLLEMILAQNMVVFITSISLFLLVSFNRQVSFGPYDLGLLTVSYGIPAVICSFCAGYEFFGATGYWCLTDAFKDKSRILHQILGSIQIIIATLIILFYSMVWISISNSARRLRKFDSKKPQLPITTVSKSSDGEHTSESGVPSSDVDIKSAVSASVADINVMVEGNPVTKLESNQERNKLELKRHKSYKSTAKILTLFVFAYIAQWWPMISVPIWQAFQSIPLTYYPACMFFLNLGGLFNLLAYTLARRLYAQNKKAGVVSA